MAKLTYKQNPGYEKHKLRVLINKDSKPVCGICVSYDKIEPLLGCYFTTTIQGTTIILQSGTAPQVKK